MTVFLCCHKIVQSNNFKKNVDEIHDMIMVDQRLTRRTPNTEGISHESAENDLGKELGITKVTAQWGPGLLTSDQKDSMFIISSENVRRLVSGCNNG